METQRRTNRATITDVAEAAGVSRTTVSYVLSGRLNARVPEPTRRRILDAAERMGYRRNALAAAFRSGRMNTVGIVAPLSLEDTAPVSVGNVYYRDLVLAVAAAAFAAGLSPLLLSEDRSRRLSLSDVTDRRADGVVLIVKENADEFARAAASAGVPCVTVGRDVGEWQVHTDNVLGARLAVGHLVGLGHRRVAHLWHGKDVVPSGRQRRDGFLCAAREAGIGSSDAPVFTDKQKTALADALRRPDGPTAVFAYNDALAVELIDLCAAIGLRVPEDVSVVGFDDNILAVSARPPLTTVHSPLEGLAKSAIDLLQRQLRGEAPPPGPVIVAPRLVVRASCAPPPVSKEK